MLFNSYQFILVYLPLVLVGYFLLGRWRRSAAIVWLVIASFFFYGYWNVRYVPLLFGSILFNFASGCLIEHSKVYRRTVLVVAITGNVVLLGYFKYTGFFIDSVNALVGTGILVPQIVLPLGISFFTFTQTAYLIDAYRGETKGYSLLTYLLFVTIFPHLIAGPIINHRAMIPQFSMPENFRLHLGHIAQGLTLFSCGLFKKVVIADSLSPWVNAVFSSTTDLTCIEAWMGALAYTFQLYFDFSGYSEMAIGLGLLLNLHFPINFNSPYQSNSIIDFWRRWHMTLGGWVKDYLYIPMGGNRHGDFKKMRNLLVSMLIIGLWHGAGWTFVFWGGMHGALLVINHQWRRFKIRLPVVLCRCLTFLSVLCAWVFFRAETFADGIAVLRAMLTPCHLGLPNAGWYIAHFRFMSEWGFEFAEWRLPASFPVMAMALLFLSVVLMFVPNPQICIDKYFADRKVPPVWVACVSGSLLAVALLLLNQGPSEFLYFQF